MKKTIIFFLLLTATITVWGYGIANSQWMSEHYASVSVRFPKEGITKKVLNHALEKEQEKEQAPKEVLAWNEKDSGQVTSAYQDKEESVKIYEVFGNSEALLPMTLLCGSYLSANDSYGCILEEGAAYRLFGSTQATGSKIILDGKTYVIRGVVKTEQNIMIIPAGEKIEEFQNLELFYDNIEQGGDLAKNFLLQNGITNDYTILEGGFYSKLISVFTLFPAWFLLLFLAKDYIHTIAALLQRRKKIRKSILYLAFGALFLAFCIWLTDFRFYVPERLIPNQWSDLEFFRVKWEGFVQFFQEAAYQRPYARDVFMMQSIKTGILLGVVTSLFAWLLYGHRKLIQSKVLTARYVSVFLVAASALAWYLLYSLGYELQIPHYYPGILIFYLMWIIYNPSSKVLETGYFQVKCW